MKTKVLLVLILVLGVSLAALVIGQSDRRAPKSDKRAPIASDPGDSRAGHSHTHSPERVPAFEKAPQAANLAATLAPSQFIGKSREAYKVAKEIPETLAQLPCYCHCDQSFGHRSLHTCFVDDHASQCAVCVDEALLAYRLQKDRGLNPEQVREVIIEKYSARP
jgi:hypothetical protein